LEGREDVAQTPGDNPATAAFTTTTQALW
jgi:hypothetical protein